MSHSITVIYESINMKEILFASIFLLFAANIISMPLTTLEDMPTTVDEKSSYHVDTTEIDIEAKKKPIVGFKKKVRQMRLEIENSDGQGKNIDVNTAVSS